MDGVGPFPKTKSGHHFLVTVMCAATRFPEAIEMMKILRGNLLRILWEFPLEMRSKDNFVVDFVFQGLAVIRFVLCLANVYPGFCFDYTFCCIIFVLVGLVPMG